MIQLPVISTAFSQLGEKNNGKGTAIFHTFIEIGDKNYKLNVDCGSCITALFSELIEKDGLKTLLHSHTFKISWIESINLGVKHSCFVSIDFHLYFWRTL